MGNCPCLGDKYEKDINNAFIEIKDNMIKNIVLPEQTNKPIYFLNIIISADKLCIGSSIDFSNNQTNTSLTDYMHKQLYILNDNIMYYICSIIIKSFSYKIMPLNKAYIRIQNFTYNITELYASRINEKITIHKKENHIPYGYELAYIYNKVTNKWIYIDTYKYNRGYIDVLRDEKYQQIYNNIIHSELYK